MRSEADLIRRARQPGALLKVVEVRVAGKPTEIPPDQARPRRVIGAHEGAINMEGGKFLPLGCVATLVFDGAPDRFEAHLGPAVLVYEFANGTA